MVINRTRYVFVMEWLVQYWPLPKDYLLSLWNTSIIEVLIVNSWGDLWQNLHIPTLCTCLPDFGQYKRGCNHEDFIHDDLIHLFPKFQIISPNDFFHCFYARFKFVVSHCNYHTIICRVGSRTLKISLCLILLASTLNSIFPRRLECDH